MRDNLKQIHSAFDFKINKCSYGKNTKVVDTDKGKFVIKKNNRNNHELFRYLESKNFHNFLPFYNYNQDYEVYPFIDSIDMTKEEKALDIVYLVALLHNKTTFYKAMDIDILQKIYEDVTSKLDYLNHYYENLKMVIEEEVYMSPGSYLFLRNSSIIFKCIEESKYFIDKWYQLSKTKKNYRVVTIHNYLELDHLLKGDNSYLISWDKACRASPIYDVISLYQSTYEQLDFSSLFDFYNSKYPLLEEEMYLLFALLLAPIKIDISNREIVNTKNVYTFCNYLITTASFVSKYHSKSTNH